MVKSETTTPKRTVARRSRTKKRQLDPACATVEIIQRHVEAGIHALYSAVGNPDSDAFINLDIDGLYTHTPYTVNSDFVKFMLDEMAMCITPNMIARAYHAYVDGGLDHGCMVDEAGQITEYNEELSEDAEEHEDTDYRSPGGRHHLKDGKPVWIVYPEPADDIKKREWPAERPHPEDD